MVNPPDPCKVHLELADPALWPAMRSLLASRFPFLVHRANASALADIIATGLRPSPQSPAADVDPSCLARTLNGRRPEILCLKPPESKLSLGGKRFIEFAVSTAELPLPLGLDWSYGACWTRAKNLRMDCPSAPLPEVFVTVVASYGSVVVYDSIAPEQLLVRVQNSEEDPAHWPPLSDVVSVDDMRIFR